MFQKVILYQTTELNNLNNIETICAFQAGEKAAEEFIFKKFYKPLCLFAFNIVDETMAAEDIATESLLKAFVKRGEFKTIEGLKAFLFICVRNSCINFCKAKKRQEQRFKEISFSQVIDTDEWDNTSLNEMYKAEIINEIYNRIETLPAKCQRIFKLAFLKQLSPSEIANEMSIDPQTVRSQKSRALQLLRMQLHADKIFSGILLVLSLFFI